MPWQPRFEIQRRRLVSPAQRRKHLWMEPGTEPIYRRALLDAGLADNTIENPLGSKVLPMSPE